MEHDDDTPPRRRQGRRDVGEHDEANGDGRVSAEQVEATRQRVHLIEALAHKTLQFTDETWRPLIDQRLAAALPSIVRTLARLQTTGHVELNWFRERAVAFVDRLDPADASTALHALVGDGDGLSRAAIDLIAQANLRDLAALRRMREASDPVRRRRQLQLLGAAQRMYTSEDLDHLRAIANLCTADE